MKMAHGDKARLVKEALSNGITTAKQINEYLNRNGCASAHQVYISKLKTAYGQNSSASCNVEDELRRKNAAAAPHENTDLLLDLVMGYDDKSLEQIAEIMRTFKNVDQFEFISHMWKKARDAASRRLNRAA
jgi:hypothetical protein